jgi:hypothetical protein
MVLHQPPAEQEQSRLLTLPLEVRLEIYSYLQQPEIDNGDDNDTLCARHTIPSPERHLIRQTQEALLVTCRQIGYELGPVLYRSKPSEIYPGWRK